MFVRMLSSAAAGLTITAGLLYLMHFLIDISEGAVHRRPPIRIEPWGRTIDDSDLIVDEEQPKRIVDPVLPPPPHNKVDPGEEYTSVGVRPVVDHPAIESLMPSVFRLTDGALINVIAVEANYPTAASSRGLEGHVVVQFDVTSMGTVTNVVVVESSSRLFNKSAINAAKKFRFKPKVIDGVPQESYGVQRLFTFEMEKN